MTDWKDADKWLEEAGYFESAQFRDDFSLTDEEKNSLEDLGRELGVADLSAVFTAAVKAGFKNSCRVAMLQDEKTGAVVEELTISGQLLPSMNKNSPRQLRLSFDFNRYIPKTEKQRLLSLSFTQARNLASHVDKEKSPDKLVMCASTFLTTPASEIIIPGSNLPEMQKLNRAFMESLSGKKFTILQETLRL